MKTIRKTAIALAALGLSAWVITAQNTPAPGGAPQAPDQGPPPGPGGPGGPGGPPRRPPIPPLIHALDANHDGVIDAGEIANASAALATLDKNGDGQLTMDELLPPPPPGGPRRHRPPPPPNDDGQAPPAPGQQ
jgi:hypothetical protein